ncbi:RagB/SusD family nutrient uptake outer membrane protein [Pricia sp.]|uniref:RagB/SusD family nutrient uptake outer membrane protein n=1 Tax=Pricia sp. TaxID=2268138 RepID=UPI003593D245
MKSYINKTKVLSLTLVLFIASCSESEFLDEEPLDFFDPTTSFVSAENFESSLIDLYAKKRDMHYGGDDITMHLIAGTDIFFNARETADDNRFGSFVSVLNPTKQTPLYYWTRNFKIISNANTVIAKLEESELVPEEKLKIEAEARLFRGLAYRDLVYLFGGVPTVTEELTEPKTDFVRAAKVEVLNLILDDAEFAATIMPNISDVQDGRLSNLVAQHLLAETYISLGNYADAITAASVVIEDPNTALMTERFGSLSGEEGDVYWNLFRVGNQNRSSGNTEALWVAQMEVDIPGGLLDGGGNAGNVYERNHVPAIWTLNDPDGNNGFLGARSDDNVGGRGVSFVRGTPLMETTLWQSDFDNDIRNSQYNIQRTLVYDNPESAFVGQSALEFPGSVIQSADWRWYPWLTKATTPGQHPVNLYSNQELGLLNNGAGSTYRDQYYLRLAETYLLRAEAYMMNGNLDLAAADINVVRVRSGATLVTAGEVDLDNILDERARELGYEEQRRITLQRTGKLVERVREYNPFNASEIQDFHGLWPIPAKEIEANINGNLEQNPGY